MSNLKQKHKDYLIKNEIKDLTDLVNYVEILRNTSNLEGEDRQMLFDFAFLITNEQLSLKSFFAENKNPSKEFFNAFKQNTENEDIYKRVRVNFYRILPAKTIQVREFTSIEDAKKYFSTSDYTEAFYYMYATNELIEKEEKSKNSPTFMDEVLDSNTTITEEPNFVLGFGFIPRRGKIITYNTSCKDINKTDELKPGKKESQTVRKAPIFTFCKQMKNAIEEMAFRTEYGHNKYIEFDADYNNFARVDNGDEEYANAQFRHALGIGEDSELEHYVASAWDAVARLEIYLRNKVK